jgi:hypothetical protein
MNRYSAILILTLTVSLSLGALAPRCDAHPFHASIAEAEFNVKTGKLEVALRLHPVDLEAALRDIHGKAVDLDNTKNIDDLILNYLNTHFRIAETRTKLQKSLARKNQTPRKSLQLNWIGKEITTKWTWAYFEFDTPANLADYSIVNTIFFDRLDDQVNTINFRNGTRRWSRHFTIDNSENRLAPAPQQPKPKI